MSSELTSELTWLSIWDQDAAGVVVYSNGINPADPIITEVKQMQTAPPQTTQATGFAQWLRTFRNHGPEYFMEAAAVGLLMLSTCVMAVLLEHPMSPIHEALEGEPIIRHLLRGLLVGLSALWIYLTAPLAGMLCASALYCLQRGVHRVFCAKLHHSNDQPCIFRCRHEYLFVE